jgi:hypothetical protein
MSLRNEDKKDVQPAAPVAKETELQEIVRKNAHLKNLFESIILRCDKKLSLAKQTQLAQGEWESLVKGIRDMCLGGFTPGTGPDALHGPPRK